MIDLLLEIGQTLSHNKLRTALTGFAVMWGIFMLIILLGMGHGVFNAFSYNMGGDRTKSINVWGGMTTKPYKGYQEMRYISLEYRDLSAIDHDGRGVIAKAVAIKDLDSAQVSTQKDYVTDRVSGVFPSAATLEKLKITRGRFINDNDLIQKRKVIVLNERSARMLFGDEDKAVGNYVNAMKLSWQVVGVYSHDWQDNAYVPFETAMALSGTNGRVSTINVLAPDMKTQEDADAAEKLVKNILAREHEFDPTDSGGVYIWNRFTGYLQGMTAMTILEMAIWIIGILTMLTGIVGVSNIMFVSVKERTHEIGIRRAIGAKPRSILMQIITESVALTALFGYIGIFFGMIVLAGLSKAFAGMEFIRDPSVTLSIAVEVTVVLVVAGAFAGLFPAIKATKVKPVEALRDE
ncbi:MAG TPA: ABC transporter permease [Porphyromonadaceae bacterium]|nr:ABC transporter permease [Porphyromonadaceae bacterium]